MNPVEAHLKQLENLLGRPFTSDEAARIPSLPVSALANCRTAHEKTASPMPGWIYLPTSVNLGLVLGEPGNWECATCGDHVFNGDPTTPPPMCPSRHVGCTQGWQ